MSHTFSVQPPSLKTLLSSVPGAGHPVDSPPSWQPKLDLSTQLGQLGGDCDRHS